MAKVDSIIKRQLRAELRREYAGDPNVVWALYIIPWLYFNRLRALRQTRCGRW